MQAKANALYKNTSPVGVRGIGWHKVITEGVVRLGMQDKDKRGNGTSKVMQNRDDANKMGQRYLRG